MYIALIRKELRATKSVLLFALIALFACHTYSQHHPDLLTLSPRNLIAQAYGIASLLALLIAAQLVADERQSGTFVPLTALPVPPYRLWLVKYLFGLVVSLISAIGATVIIAQAGIPDPSRALVYAYLLAFYTISFTISCFSTNTIIAVLISFVAGSVYGAGAGIYIGGRTEMYNSIAVILLISGILSLSLRFFLRVHRTPLWVRTYRMLRGSAPMMFSILRGELKRISRVLGPALLIIAVLACLLRGLDAGDVGFGLLLFASLLAVPLYIALFIHNCRRISGNGAAHSFLLWLLVIVLGYAVALVFATAAFAIVNALHPPTDPNTSGFLIDYAVLGYCVVFAVIGASLARRLWLSLLLAVIISIGGSIALNSCLLFSDEGYTEQAAYLAIIPILLISLPLFMRTIAAPGVAARLTRIIRTLIFNNLRLLLPIIVAFMMLAALLLVRLHSLGGADADGIVGYLVVSRLLTLFFAIVVANRLVAGERAERTLGSVLALPLHPVVIGSIKFLLGLALVLLFSSALSVVLPAPVGDNPDQTFGRVSTTTIGNSVGKRFLGNGIQAIVDAQFSSLLYVYALAFLASCIAPGPMVGVFLSLLFPLLVITLLMLPLLATGMDSPDSRVIAFLTHDKFMGDNIVSLLFSSMPALLIIIAAIAALLSLQYFRTVFRARSFGRSAVRTAGYALILLPLLWIMLLLVGNLPFLTTFSPPFATAAWHDPAYRASSADLIATTQRFRETFNPISETDDAYKVIDAAQENLSEPMGDDVRLILKRTNRLRDDIFAYYSRHNLKVVMPEVYTEQTSPELRCLFLISIFDHEQLAVLDEYAGGNSRAALARLARMTKLGEHLLELPSVLPHTVGQSCLIESLITADALLARDPNLLDPALLNSYAQLERRCTQRLPALTADALRLQGLIRAEYTIDMTTGSNWFVYPLANPDKIRQVIVDEYAGIADLMEQQDYAGVMKRAEQEGKWQALMARELILRPLNAVAISLAGESPRQWRITSLTPQVLSVMRTVLLRQYALLYERETGHAPATTAELYRHFRSEPLLNPFIGNEFPLEEVLALSTDELKEYAIARQRTQFETRETPLQ